MVGRAWKWTPARLARLSHAANQNSFGNLTIGAFEFEFKEMTKDDFTGAKRRWNRLRNSKPQTEAPDPPPTIFTIGLGGMWCDRPTRGPVHSDTVRATELRHMLKPHNVVCLQNGNVGNAASNDSLTVDFRAIRGWYRRCRDGKVDPDTIIGRGVTIFILDYYWLPQIYYEQNNHPNGYGGGWFAKLIPFFFQEGGIIAVLPNDKFGMLRAMHAAAVVDGGVTEGVKWLTKKDALLCHPLYMATESITVDGALRGAGLSHGGGRTNATQAETYLDKQHPFCLVYNVRMCKNPEDATALMQALPRQNPLSKGVLL